MKTTRILFVDNLGSGDVWPFILHIPPQDYD
jgi:hypothetical protein